MVRLRKTGGFTLIELMLTAAIIGLLAAIALPKFGNLIIKSKEASIKGKLGSLRSAIHIYYCDTEGMFPDSSVSMSHVLRDALVNKYIDAIPMFSIPTVTNIPHQTTTHRVWNSAGPMDSWMVSGWGYNYDGNTGHVAINCTHNDSTGNVIWSEW